MRALTVAALAFVLTGCDPSIYTGRPKDSSDEFSYESRSDDFTKITTSFSKKSFWINEDEQQYVDVTIECIKNNSDDSQSTLSIYLASMADNKASTSDVSTYLDALMYKIDNSDVAIYDPSDMLATKNYKIDLFNMIPRDGSPIPHNLGLRVVYGAPPAILDRTVQFYSQYPSVDMDVPLTTGGSGKVIADCVKQVQ